MREELIDKIHTALSLICTHEDERASLTFPHVNWAQQLTILTLNTCL